MKQTNNLEEEKKFDHAHTEFENEMHMIIARDMLNNSQKYFLTKDEDSIMDGLEYFWERLPKMQFRFRPDQCDFKNYCIYSARKYAMTLKRKKYDLKIMDYIVQNRFSPAEYTQPCSMTNHKKPCVKQGDFGLKRSWKKKIHILALKCAWFIEQDTLVSKIAKAIEYEPSDLMEEIDTLRRSISASNPRYLHLMQMRDKIFGNLCLAEHHLHDLSSEDEKSELERKINNLRQKLAEYNTKIKKIKMFASHAEIGRTLGIPKGTIDSIMFSILHQTNLFDLSDGGETKKKDDKNFSV